MTFYLRHIGVSLSRQRIELRGVDPLGLGVVGGETYTALHTVGIEVGYITTIQHIEHTLIGHVVAHTVEQIHKLRVGLPIYLVQLNHSITHTCQSAAAEKVWRGIILTQNLPLLVLHNRRQLTEVAYHEQLHTTERLVAVTAEPQHVVNRIEHIGTHHAYLVYHEQVDGAYHSLLLTAHTHL